MKLSIYAAPLALAAALPGNASAEIFCSVSKFRISTYIYGMPALEMIQLSAGGGTMQNVSLCGTNCTDEATNQRLSLAVSAQARGIPLLLYFGTATSCAGVAAYEKPYAVMLEQ